MGAAYWNHFAARWRRFAFFARYGNQRIVDLLGRRMTALEEMVFLDCLAEILENENDKASDTPANDDETS